MNFKTFFESEELYRSLAQDKNHGLTILADHLEERGFANVREMIGNIMNAYEDCISFEKNPRHLRQEIFKFRKDLEKINLNTKEIQVITKMIEGIIKKKIASFLKNEIKKLEERHQDAVRRGAYHNYPKYIEILNKTIQLLNNNAPSHEILQTIEFIPYRNRSDIAWMLLANAAIIISML